MEVMVQIVLAIFLLSFSATNALKNSEVIGGSSSFLTEASRFVNHGVHVGGKRWAVLIAGSKGWVNYRHQADVCHAYQVLKKGGIKDKNIIVMMYDDIAHNPKNPRPGVIIHSPKGGDVYHGVPKDYIGKDVNENNFFNVILGNKTALKGGSGKVVNSRPNDHIFIYYSDHGTPLMLGMPNGYITAGDLNKILKQKYDSRAYKSMVFYLEACEAGSMFEGLLSPELNIYATTASNPYENSWGYYCPGKTVVPPSEYDTCLGDLYSIAWMEDCEHKSTAKETLHQQYQRIKKRTVSSHVMEYGDLSMSKKKLSVYLGTQSTNDTYVDEMVSEPQFSSVNQRDADLLHFREKYQRAPEGSQQKLEAKKEFIEAMEHRKNVDSTIKMIVKLLFGSGMGLEVMQTGRSAGQAPVDDWDCFKSMLHTYEAKCGGLSVYARKYTRVFANFCNAGIRHEHMENAVAQACFEKV